ncbi:hypothetical protein MJT46_010912 [Ovis ammon polii x Ovis aries]|nr:hypothetical protein MJT46_010912 [Ovis ammon polii x Ovis aries]
MNSDELWVMTSSESEQGRAKSFWIIHSLSTYQVPDTMLCPERTWVNKADGCSLQLADLDIKENAEGKNSVPRSLVVTISVPPNHFSLRHLPYAPIPYSPSKCLPSSLEQNWFRRRKKGMKLKRIKSRKAVSVGFTLRETEEGEKEPEAEGKGPAKVNEKTTERLCT